VTAAPVTRSPSILGSPCKPLGVGATLAWSAAALVAWIGAQVALAVAAGYWFASANIAGDGTVVSVVVIGAAPVALIVIAVAAWTARCGIVEYLALHWPAPRHIALGVLCLAVLIPVVDAASWLAGRDVSPSFVTAVYRSARDTGALPLLVLALAVATPFVEEALFRGLLLPGLAASRLGPTAAIGLTAAAWALMHMQYAPFYLIQAMAFGVAFGWLRWRSGSTLLTIVLHGIVNLVSLLQAGAVVEGLV
jgi:membrane protease YdiL (CAAX protease family)